MRNERTRRIVRLALLTAIIAVMAFTPLGYIRTPTIEITLLHLPVLLGAVWFGPAAGAFLGLVFGVTSFIQCFGLSVFGAALLGISPFATFIVCIVPRVLFGWLAALIFRWLSRALAKYKHLAYVLTGLLGSLLHTAMFMTTLVLLFYNTDYIQSFVQVLGARSILGFIILFVGVNGLIEISLGAVLTYAVGYPVNRYLHRGQAE